MNRAKAYTYFRNNFVLKKGSQDWYAFTCPFCATDQYKMKCAVQFEIKMVKCWSCGYKERIMTFIQDVEQISYSQAWLLLDAQEEGALNLDHFKGIEVEAPKLGTLNLPEGFVSILEGNSIIGNRARSYLKWRRFDLNELDRLGVGYVQEKPTEGKEDYFGYIIIPFQYRGKLTYFLGRDFIGNYLRYKNPPKTLFGIGKSEIIYNEDALELRRVVFITEGCFDALTIGKNGIATMGWSLSEQQKQKILQSDVELIVFVPDVGFYGEAIKTAMAFLGHKPIKVLDMEKLKQYGKDANDIGKERIIKLTKQTPLLSFKEAVEAVNRY